MSSRHAKTVALLLACLSSVLPARAQVLESIRGKFQISADDTSTVFLNGIEVFATRLEKDQRVKESEPITLKLGDKLVFNLHNVRGPKGLLAQFVSEDGKHLIHFPHTAYKVLVNPKATTFTDSEFRDARTAREVKNPVSIKILPYKSKSEWTWGETDTCSLASLIARESFVPVTP